MSEFLVMGVYALFLWPAYALALLALVANVHLARRSHAEAREEARRRLALADELSAQGEGHS